MRIHYFAVVTTVAALVQAGCAMGFRREAGPPEPQPVMVSRPIVPAVSRDPAATPNVPLGIQPVAPR
jgi:hypothetical protein